jgi:hypothetical protein
MLIVLNSEDISALSPALREELKNAAFPKRKVQGPPPGFDEDSFEDVVDLSPGEIEEFMKGCAPETIAGLKVIAEHGPVIHASLLDRAGIDNYSHFQGRVTKRTRTVTGRKGVYLFTWDDWSEAPDEIGHYAVTEPTYRSLRIYFNLA